jgi:2-oxo-3-hexenedioate decarboxylase
MSPDDLNTQARHLDSARLEKRSVERLTLLHPDLSMPDAYAIQEAGIALRHSRGERTVGLKMGLTSEAKRQQMGLASPVFGELTDVMRVQDGGVFTLGASIHPKIEPEIAFEIGRELKGDVSLEEAAAACTRAFAAMEILDSRYRDFKYFSLPDVVADNSSSSHFVIAREGLPLAGLALETLSIVMSVNGEEKQRALGSAISGHPVRSVVQLCALLAERGRVLPKGSIVLAGAATVAEVLKPGDVVRSTVSGLGSVEVRVSA